MRVYILLFILSFTACNGAGGLGGSSLFSPGGSEQNDGLMHEGDDPVPDAPGTSLPIGKIPAPALKFNLTVAYEADISATQSNVPYVGMAGAVDNPEGATLILSDEQDKLAFSFLSSSYRFFSRIHLIPQAHAETLQPNVLINHEESTLNPQTSTNSTVCSQEGVTCCPVEANGSFQCYLPINHSLEKIHVALMDKDGNIGEPTEEKIQQNLLWEKESPKAYASGADGELYSLTQDVAVQITPELNDDGSLQLRVNGDHGSNYSSFAAAGGESLGFDSSTEVMGIMKPGEGIELRAMNPNGVGFVNQGVLKNIPDTLDYKKLKLSSDSLLRFIRKPNFQLNPHPQAFIDYALGGTPLDPNPLQDKRIYFLQNNAAITYKDSIAYDVGPNGCGLLLFKDVNEAYRLRVNCKGLLQPTYLEFGGEVPLQGTNAQSDFEELIIYHEILNGGKIDGKALLIDKGNNKIWQIAYHITPKVMRLRDPSSITAILEEQSSLSFGSTIKAVTWSPDKKHLYILHDQEKTVEQIQLLDGVGLPLTIQGMDGSRQITRLKNLVQKPIELNPTTLSFHKVDDEKSYLIVGMENLKGALVIEE